jgi:signal transduction histidine kinase/putative methionine-R-sulfoxide reductase with GAF domain
MDVFQNLVAQNRLLTEEVKRRVDQLAAINTVAAAVSQSLDLSNTLQTALQAVLNITGAEAGGISLIDELTNEVVLRAQQGWMHDFVRQRAIRVPVGRGMSGRVIAEDSVIIWNNLAETSQELHVPSFRDEAFQSLIMAPMHAQGKIIGILSLMSYQRDAFDEELKTPLQAIADTVGVALDNARLYEASVENKNRLSAILRSSADGIIATDQAGRIQLINSAAQAMLSVSSDDVIGCPLREAPIASNLLDGLLFALSAHVPADQADVLVGSAPYGEEGKRMFQVSLENGRILSVMVSPVYVDRQLQESDATDGWVVVLQDVTHLHQAELARTQFIQAAAHDMRNPLGVALNSLEMLGRGLTDAASHELIQIATSGISRINALLDDLLNLEQIQSGIGFNLSEVDIRDVIEEISAEVWRLLDEHKLHYRVELQPGIPDLTIDRRWVMRAIYNYLDNAVKYTPAGGNIVLRVFVKEPMIYIEVSDDGPGIPFEQQARIFERFYRANGTAHIPGTGLGLAIVKSVAELHGGGVYLKSEPGQGSTFGMTLLLSPVRA